MLDQPSISLTETAAMLTAAWEECIMPGFRNPDEEVEVKGLRTTASGKVEKDVVTASDKRVGPFVRASLRQTDPGRVLVNEENRKLGAVLLELDQGEKATLDDLDGSEWFAKGLPDFGILFSKTNDGSAYCGFVLCTYEREDGSMDCSIVMGDDESGVWFTPGRGQKPVRVLPFAERSIDPDKDVMSGYITARYFNNGLLRYQDVMQPALTETGKMIDLPGLHLIESGSAVRLWTDFLLGKVDFVSLTPTRPWDQNAGGYLTQRLGGVAKSMDDWENYKQSRIDGGISAMPSEAAAVTIANRLYISGAGPMNCEPCVPDLLKPVYEPVEKERLRRLAERSPAVCVNSDLAP